MPSHFPCLAIPGKHYLTISPYIWSFQFLYINNIGPYLSLFIWLISLNIMPSKFIHVAENTCNLLSRLDFRSSHMHTHNYAQWGCAKRCHCGNPRKGIFKWNHHAWGLKCLQKFAVSIAYENKTMSTLKKQERIFTNSLQKMKFLKAS